MPLIKLRQASEPQLFYLDRSREQSKVSIIRHIFVKSFHVESHHSGIFDSQNTLPLLRWRNSNSRYPFYFQFFVYNIEKNSCMIKFFSYNNELLSIVHCLKNLSSFSRNLSSIKVVAFRGSKIGQYWYCDHYCRFHYFEFPHF